MSNTHRTGWGTDRTMWVPGRLADYRRQFEKTARKEGEDSSIFPIALETLAVKAFGDMSHITRLRLIRDRFIAGHDSCALRRHLDSVAPETPIRDIVGCGRAMPTQRWKLIGTNRGRYCHRVARIILVCVFRVPGGCPFYHRSKSTGGGIKMAAAICTVEAAIFTILK